MATKKTPRELDKIDHSILRALQREGRLSFTDLADRVGLSTTPCIERVRRLERDGFITGYQANVDPVMLGFKMLVFVEISLSYKSADTFENFSKAVSDLPYILECHLISGEADYLLKARLEDMSQYRELLGEMLLRLPGVTHSKSYIVMESVKETFQILGQGK